MRPTRPSRLGLRGLMLALAVVAPFAAHGQADKKAAAKKYQRDIAAFYDSLTIVEVEMPQGVLQAEDIFRPTFKVANQGERALTVPLRPGTPADAITFLGQSIWTIRRLGGSPAKREAPRMFFGISTAAPGPTIEPKAVVPVAPPQEGLTIKWMGLQTGDYEVTFSFGMNNGPKTKSVIRKFRVENATSAADLAKEKAASMNASRQSFGEFAQSVFVAIKPGELTLSNPTVSVGAPLQATYVIGKAEGREIPSPDSQNKQYALGYMFRLVKNPGTKNRQQIWSREILLNWDTLAIMREQGSFTMPVPIETVGLAPGAYELSVEVLHVEGVANAPRVQKESFVIVK